jgi:hypothetical protein
MSEVRTIKCDECAKLRVNDSNHWLEGTTTGHEIFIAPIGGLNTILIAPRTGTQAEKTWKDLPELSHFCGQECAMKWAAVKLGILRLR